VSTDPILTVDGVRAAIAAKPVVAVSPIVGGRAVKGPLAGMIETLAGRAPSAAAIADHYGGLLRGLVLEAYGAGNGPTEAWFLDPLRAAVARGVVVVATTQCRAGRIHGGRSD